MSDVPRIGPVVEPPSREPVTNSQVLRVMGFLILLGTLGLPLTILLWKWALS